MKKILSILLIGLLVMSFAGNVYSANYEDHKVPNRHLFSADYEYPYGDIPIWNPDGKDHPYMGAEYDKEKLVIPRTNI